MFILPYKCPWWSVHSMTPLSCQTLAHSRRCRIKVCSQQGYYVRRAGKRLENVSEGSKAAWREEVATSNMLLEKKMMSLWKYLDGALHGTPSHIRILAYWISVTFSGHVLAVTWPAKCWPLLHMHNYLLGFVLLVLFSHLWRWCRLFILFRKYWFHPVSKLFTKGHIRVYF